MWDNLRYHSLDYELKKTYGRKIYKLALDGGMTCPNRDGTLDHRGCIFCSGGGSGDFAAAQAGSVTEQITTAKATVAAKISNPEATGYIAYFQAYTNTYAPLEYLRPLFMEAILHPDITILSIATRPDCINDEILQLLQELNQIKPVWIELGLQTIHETSARWIRRGYPLEVFEICVTRLRAAGIDVIVHTILGLPYETKHDMLETMEYLSYLPIQGIKLQLLHYLKNTDLGSLYETGKITRVLTLGEYVDLVIECLERIPGDLVIHRITGDGPKKLLLAPLWSSNKKQVLNQIHKRLKELDTYQGKYIAGN